jgi:hypothetical protein
MIPERDMVFAGFIVWLKANWFPQAINMCVTNLTSNIGTMPPAFLWKIPRSIDVGTLTNIWMTDVNYLKSIWPTLQIVMGENITNYHWVAMTATTFAVCDMLKKLPEILKETK